MTMTQKMSDNAPLDPDDELLVAYLDGELSRQDQADLEDRLMSEDGLRDRLQQLQGGWDLLDSLPDPEPSLKLVESTLELVVDDILKGQPKTHSLHRFRFPAIVALISVVGVLATVAVAATRKSLHYRQQLNDLAIAEYVDAYLYGSDLSLMRQLSANRDWLSMVSSAVEMGDIGVDEIADLSGTSLEDRDELLRTIPPESMDQLNSRWERFRRLDESNREEVRRTAAAVAAQPDAESLLDTMAAYAIWRENLPAQLRDGIEKGEGAEQREAIQKAIEHTQLSISRRSSMKLTDEAFDAIYVALRQILDERIEDQDPEIRSLINRLQNDPNAEIAMLARLVFRSPSGRGGFMSRGPRGPSGQGVWERPEPLREDELQMVRWVLPDHAADLLDLAANGDPILESITLRTWAEETLRRKFPRRREGGSKLERYLEIPESSRDSMDLLPPDRFLNELSRDFGRMPPPMSRN